MTSSRVQLEVRATLRRPSISVVSEPRAVATGSYAQLSKKLHFASYCVIRSLPLAVLTRLVATLTFNYTRSRVRGLAAFRAKRETTANDHLEDQVIGAACHPDAYPKVELPLRRDIEVDGRKDLMLLFALWIKTAQRSERSVIFKAAIDLFRDRVGDFEIRRELKATLSARSIES